MQHYINIGLYRSDVGPSLVFGYIQDDFGNLVPINEYQFDQNVYIRTGILLQVN